MQPAVYILANRSRSVLYVGVTADLARRVHEHKEHLDCSSFTTRYRVSDLVYFELHATMEAAIAREKQLKAGSRKRKDWLIFTKNPDRRDLFSSLIG